MGDEEIVKPKEDLVIYDYVEGEEGEEPRPFYSEDNPIALTNYVVNIELMGFSIISSKLKYAICLDKLFTGLQYVMFRGERYFIKSTTPSSSYSSESVMYIHELEFISEKDIKLGKIYFTDVVDTSGENDSYKSNSTHVLFYGDLHQFVSRLNSCSNQFALGYSFVVDSNITTENKMVDMNDLYILDAMKAAFDLWKIPFYFIGKEAHFGKSNGVIDSPFEYGVENQLVSIHKNNANKDIIRRITGNGSSENIPYYYPNETPVGNIELVSSKNIRITNGEKLVSELEEGERLIHALCYPQNPSEKWIRDINYSEYTGELCKVNLPLDGASPKVRIFYDIYTDLHQSYTINIIPWLGVGVNELSMSARNGILLGAITSGISYLYIPSTNSYIQQGGVTIDSIDGILSVHIASLPSDGDKAVGCIEIPIWTNNLLSNNLYQVIFAIDILDAANGVSANFSYSYEISNAIKIYNGGNITPRPYTDILSSNEITVPESFTYSIPAQIMFKVLTDDDNAKIALDVKVVFTGSTSYPDVEYDAIEQGWLSSSANIYKVDNNGMSLGSFTSELYIKDGKLTNIKKLSEGNYIARFTLDIPWGRNGRGGYTAIRIANSIAPVPYWYSETKDYESLSQVGVSSTYILNNGDYVFYNITTKLPFSSVLMPPIYRESLGLDRYYNALNNTHLKKGSDTEYYRFKNQYSHVIPSEHKENNDEIKPTIKGIVNANNQVIAQFLDIAFDRDDNDFFDTNNDNYYQHPYFFVKLPRFDGNHGFNLFDSASEKGDITLSMTSGSCGGCSFIVGIDEESGKNIVQVDSAGNLKRDAETGNVLITGTPQDRQNNTMENEVWIALKKDDTTFGIVMPNVVNNYKPSAGDTFVILNISLPKAYILAAEEDLKYFLLDTMVENNEDKFNFDIDFSKIYFGENPTKAEELKENATVTVIYNSDPYEFQIKSLSYEVSEESALPKIKVSLSEEVVIRKTLSQQFSTQKATKDIVIREINISEKKATAKKTSAETSGVDVEQVENIIKTHLPEQYIITHEEINNRQKIITHDKRYNPVVKVVDSDGYEVVVTVAHTQSTIILTWNNSNDLPYGSYVVVV